MAEISGVHRVSYVALEDRPIPEDLAGFLLHLADVVYGPVFAAKPSDRWQVLQDILTGPWATTLRDFPRSGSIGDGEPAPLDDPAQALARSLARLFDESEPESEALERGADYLRRRTRLLRRRGTALVRDYAGMSHTASRGFVWALLFIALSGFYAQHSTLDYEDAYEFVLLVLTRAGVDQYLLLRVAENELIDQEDEDRLVVEGELSPRDEQMERDTHHAWLEVRGMPGRGSVGSPAPFTR